MKESPKTEYFQNDLESLQEQNIDLQINTKIIQEESFKDPY